jgi:hypothetical protein
MTSAVSDKYPLFGYFADSRPAEPPAWAAKFGVY